LAAESGSGRGLRRKESEEGQPGRKSLPQQVFGRVHLWKRVLTCPGGFAFYFGRGGGKPGAASFSGAGNLGASAAAWRVESRTSRRGTRFDAWEKKKKKRRRKTNY